MKLAPWLAALWLAGCAPPVPDLPPLLGLGARTCPPAPQTTVAQAVEPDGKIVFADIDAGSACLATPEGDSLYTIFRLPAGQGPLAAAVASMQQGRTMMAPRLFTLDAADRVVRDVAADRFLYRGGMLSTLVRLRPEEMAIMVASYPPAIGQGIAHIQSATQATTVASGPVIFTVYSGSEATANYTLAHNGRVRIEVYKLPPDQRAP